MYSLVTLELYALIASLSLAGLGDGPPGAKDAIGLRAQAATPAPRSPLVQLSASASGHPRRCAQDATPAPRSPLAQVGGSACGHPRQDGTYDGDVDLFDFGDFVECLSTSMSPTEMPCLCFDQDADSDIDLQDFARFQAVFGWTLCQPANPSFEFAGELGNAFAGWYQFGNVAAPCKIAPHGHHSVRVTGATNGNWAVSGVWQRLAAKADDSWSVAVHLAHGSTNRLTGGSRGIVNVEWYEGDTLLDHQSHPVLTPGAPVDTTVRVPLQVGPAPAGTDTLHLVAGVLQDPNEPVADVFFDLIEFFPPDMDSNQWADFRGRRTLMFSGYSWRVKGPGEYAPGPSEYGDKVDHVWLDGNDLHLTVKRVDDSWFSTEVALEEPLGYGDYIVTTVGSLGAWDLSVVLGLFLYQYPPCWEVGNTWWNPANEIDIEYSRWGNPSNDAGQFATQPSELPHHKVRFPVAPCEGELRSHAFRWRPTCVEFRSWCGAADDEAPETIIREWTYAGPNVPRPEQARMHVNFWRGGDLSDSWTDHEIIIREFRFLP